MPQKEEYKSTVDKEVSRISGEIAAYERATQEIAKRMNDQETVERNKIFDDPKFYKDKVCEYKNLIAAANEAIKRENEIGNTSGFVDKARLYKAGSMVCYLIGIAYSVTKRILNNFALFFETLFKPKLIYVQMRDDDIKIKYHELDNKEHGYNPLRQDFAPLELFSQKSVISQIKADAEKLFPRVDFKTIQGKDTYREAQSYFLRMLVERALMIEKGQWNTDLEKQWVNFKGRPKQMLELDSYYMDWHYKQLGQENNVATKLVS